MDDEKYFGLTPTQLNLTFFAAVGAVALAAFIYFGGAGAVKEYLGEEQVAVVETGTPAPTEAPAAGPAQEQEETPAAESDPPPPPPQAEEPPAAPPPPPPAPTPTPAPDNSEFLNDLGYEDGYLDGYADGSVGGTDQASYYIDPTIGIDYAWGYNDGYSVGHGDGWDYFTTIPRGCFPNTDC